MGVRFQKRLSIFPGFRLNFSASGVSATIGIPGASVTLGGRGGPMANVGIPGSGFSTRFPLRQKPRRPEAPSPADDTPINPDAQEVLDHLNRRIVDRAFGRRQASPPPMPPQMNTIGSSATTQLSSPHLVELRDLIATAHARHSESAQIVEKFESETGAQTKTVEALRDEIKSLQEKLQKWQSSRIRFLYRGRIRRANSRAIDLTAQAQAALNNLQTARSSLQEAENARDESWLDGTFALDGPVGAAWRALENAFYNLSQSQHIWDITAGRQKRAGEERSTATQVLERKPTTLSISPLPFFAPRFACAALAQRQWR